MNCRQPELGTCKSAVREFRDIVVDIEIIQHYFLMKIVVLIGARNDWYRLVLKYGEILNLDFWWKVLLILIVSRLSLRTKF